LLDGVGVVLNEAGALLLERFGLEVAKAFALFVRGFALHADDDAAIGKGVRERADLTDEFGAPTGEGG